MRILHTADWHIGKRLYQHQRTEEHQQFLDWLLNTIIDQHIDVLLISGDVCWFFADVGERWRFLINFDDPWMR